MKGEEVVAEIALYPTELGGLIDSLPKETTSLLLQIPIDGDEFIEVGAQIKLLNDLKLSPGVTGRAKLRFWSDAGRTLATPGTEFKVWHGREIGKGVVVPQ